MKVGSNPRRSDRCFTLTQDARAAGYKLAAPPRGDIVVGGAYLIPVTAATRAMRRRSTVAGGRPMPGRPPDLDQPPHLHRWVRVRLGFRP